MTRSEVFRGVSPNKKKKTNPNIKFHRMSGKERRRNSLALREGILDGTQECVYKTTIAGDEVTGGRRSKKVRRPQG